MTTGSRVIVVKGEHLDREGIILKTHSPKATHPLVTVAVFHEERMIGNIIGRLGKDFLIKGDTQ
jgi:hypothetical protein